MLTLKKAFTIVLYGVLASALIRIIPLWQFQQSVTGIVIISFLLLHDYVVEHFTTKKAVLTVSLCMLVLAATLLFAPGHEYFVGLSYAEGEKRLADYLTNSPRSKVAGVLDQMGLGTDFKRDVEIVYEWEHENILYRNDWEVWNVSDYWASPDETLTVRAADCEDLACLFQAFMDELAHRGVNAGETYTLTIDYSTSAHVTNIIYLNGRVGVADVGDGRAICYADVSDAVNIYYSKLPIAENGGVSRVYVYPLNRVFDGLDEAFSYVAAKPQVNVFNNETAFIQPKSVAELATSLVEPDKTTYENLMILYHFVRDNIKYADDGEMWGIMDYWQTPTETLRLGTGDCEDQAILLLSLIKAYNASLDGWLFCVSNRQVGHVALVVNFGGNITILDTVMDYYTYQVCSDRLTVCSKNAGQELTAYFDAWRLNGVEDLEARWISNEKRTVYCENTNEFIAFFGV
jgi:predicted transglutaminase-like cysteine proteinase